MPSPSAPVIAPRSRRSGGCCEAAVEPDLSEADAVELAVSMRALADPTRLRILDALRKAAPQAICQCELAPLFAISQQALSKHLGVLVAAGVIASERRGLWTHYFLLPDGLDRAQEWLR
jgi:ArsR family transcriptional regulator, arsenate/arsenite/antimonite-responsive transcriptional repressor